MSPHSPDVMGLRPKKKAPLTGDKGPNSGEGNDRHKEDFERLLDDAVGMTANKK